MIGLKLFAFQDECSDFIKDYCLDENNKKTLVVNAPTGSGKTIILLDFIDKLNAEKSRKISYIWLTPGSGELEEQSKQQMENRLPQYQALDIDAVLTHDFEDKDVCFINWERVTKKGNRAVRDSERKNLYERIKTAHLSQTEFILIVDEEHSNNTSKAKDIIDAFAPLYTIRVSATAKQNSMYDYYEIDETRVINSGLITKAIYINEGIDQKQITDENRLLLGLANNKRCAIRDAYNAREININPLVLVQFPNENDALIKSVEDKLRDLDITYDNGRLAIWMSERKENTDNITAQSNHVQFLLIKQAISVGWDCPRAKILVKLRERMSEDFEIQTIGRLRRMPEAKHYDEELLDNAYLFTFDKEYKQAVVQNLGNAYDVRKVFLKKEHKEFVLTKQLKDMDFASYGEREILDIIEQYYRLVYKLSRDKRKNAQLLEMNGYNTSQNIESTIVQDKVYKTVDMTRKDTSKHAVAFKVDTHEHGISLRQTIDTFKSIIGLSYEKTRIILEKMFRDNRENKNKFLNLDTSDFYAFIINNASQFRNDFREAITVPLEKGQGIQYVTSIIHPKEEEFKFPVEDVFKYVPVKDPEAITNNVYDGYTDECLVDPIRSLPERLFERFCENHAEWYYKNGDSGQQYLSIVYVDNARNQHLFYPDYILKINGEVWIIETKGGERADGRNKNIDKAIGIKFIAFKEYAERFNLRWGFVRDKNEKLYINNTEYVSSLDDDRWEPIKTILS